jgi:hypothetical protein
VLLYASMSVEAREERVEVRLPVTWSTAIVVAAFHVANIRYHRRQLVARHQGASKHCAYHRHGIGHATPDLAG